MASKAPDSRGSSGRARDGSGTTTEDASLSVHDLVELAHDKSKASRSKLVTAINDLYSGEERVLTETDRAIMFDILRRLIHEVEARVRGRLAERWAEQNDVPQDLVIALANDTIEIAYPILVKSELLRDEELIEIVQHRAMEHQVAIAMRQCVSEPVSDALVDTANVGVITTLLSNDGARIAPDTMDLLVEKASWTKRFQQPLAFRRDLSPRLVKKLYSGVSAALRHHIVANFDLDPGEFDEAAGATINDAVASEIDAVPKPMAPVQADNAMPTHSRNELMEALKNGKTSEFLDKFTRLSKLRITLVRRLMFEPGGEGLAVTCKAVGLEKQDFAEIFLRFRQGRIGDKRVEVDEVTRALSFFDRFSAASAKTVLHRWRQDAEYLNALRLVQEAENG